jgi:hypothetical protein
MKVEIFGFAGESATVIDYESPTYRRIVIFEDCTYNLSCDYLTQEVYEKLRRSRDSYTKYKLAKEE